MQIVLRKKKKKRKGKFESQWKSTVENERRIEKFGVTFLWRIERNRATPMAYEEEGGERGV